MFGRKKEKISSYDPATQKPVIKCSICNGEQVAGFCDIKTGAFSDIMLVTGEADLNDFRKAYGITGEIERIY